MLGPDHRGFDARLRRLACPRGFNTVLSSFVVLVAGCWCQIVAQLPAYGTGASLGTPPHPVAVVGVRKGEGEAPGSSAHCPLSFCLQSLGKHFLFQKPREGHTVDAEGRRMRTAQLK